MTLRLRNGVNVAAGLNFLAGCWLIIAPWVLGGGMSRAAAWNSVVIGLAIAVVAAKRWMAGPRRAGLSFLNVVFGGWMIASMWIFHYIGRGASAWNSAIVGTLVLVLACVSETAPEAWDTEDQDYHPAAGWDFPYLAHPVTDSEPPVWYSPSNYGQGGLGDPEVPRERPRRVTA